MITRLYRALVINRTQTLMKLLRLNTPFYQSLEELNIAGKRNTFERFERYGLPKLLKPEHEVLDIGCNTGFFSITTARYVKHVDGIDNKRINILTGKLAKRRLNVDNVLLRRSTFEKFTTNKQYDVVYSFAVHHWVNLSVKEYAKRVRSLMKPKALLVLESHDLSNLDKHFEQVVRKFSEAGFTEKNRIDNKKDGNRVCVILRAK